MITQILFLGNMSDGIQGTQKPEIATYIFGKLLGKQGMGHPRLRTIFAPYFAPIPNDRPMKIKIFQFVSVPFLFELYSDINGSLGVEIYVVCT